MNIDKDILKEYILNIKNIIKTDKYQKMKKESYMDFLNELHDIAPIFFKNYPTLLRMIIDDDDLSLLDLYIDKLDNVKSGNQDINEVKQELGYYLQDKYLNK